jgi:uncharacterized protein
MRTPDLPGLELVVVGPELDAADNWIAEHSQPTDIVLTADLPLAGRVLAQGCTCLDFRGVELTEDSIGPILATRELLFSLRDAGERIGGPPVFSQRDRGQFAARLDDLVNRLRRRRPGEQR